MFDMPVLNEKTHPLFTDRGFVIHTTQLTQLLGKVREAVGSGSNTLVVYGDPGSGKTTACLEVVDVLSDETPSFSAHVLCREYQNPKRVNINNFWNDVLIASGRIELGSRRTDADVRLYRHVMARCQSLSNHRVFFIFDEAQNLPPILLKELKNFHDKLIEAKVYPFFLFVGQRNLVTLHKKLVSNHDLDLVRRFFLRWHEYTSPMLGDITGILRSYDDVFRFPADGPTFTEFFAPQSYQAGWRLYHDANKFMASFRDLALSHTQGDVDSLGMHHIIAAIRYYLLGIHAAENSGQPVNFDELRKTAVRNCGLVEQWVAFA